MRSNFGPPLTFNLRRDPGPMPGALVKDIQEQLDEAKALRDEGRYDQALAAYESIHAKNPKLTSVNLVIAAVYRQKAEQERDAAARAGAARARIRGLRRSVEDRRRQRLREG